MLMKNDGVVNFSWSLNDQEWYVDEWCAEK